VTAPLFVLCYLKLFVLWQLCVGIITSVVSNFGRPFPQLEYEPCVYAVTARDFNLGGV